MSPSRDQLQADKTVETLQSLRDEGKVRKVRVCPACQVDLVKKPYGYKCPSCGLETK